MRRSFDAFFFSASWSPDGRSLLLSDEELYYAHIYLLSAAEDGTLPTQLMSDRRSPQWSPNGKEIVYVHTSGDDGYNQVYLMDADGKNEHALTEIDPGAILGVTWSADGSHIAFTQCMYPRPACNIYLVKTDGSQLQLLADAGDLTWSPDGLWIAFSTADYVGSELHQSVKYVLATGGPARLVVNGGYDPSWRP